MSYDNTTDYQRLWDHLEKMISLKLVDLTTLGAIEDPPGEEPRLVVLPSAGASGNPGFSLEQLAETDRQRFPVDITAR